MFNVKSHRNCEIAHCVFVCIWRIKRFASVKLKLETNGFHIFAIANQSLDSNWNLHHKGVIVCGCYSQAPALDLPPIWRQLVCAGVLMWHCLYATLINVANTASAHSANVLFHSQWSFACQVIFAFWWIWFEITPQLIRTNYFYGLNVLWRLAWCSVCLCVCCSIGNPFDEPISMFKPGQVHLSPMWPQLIGSLRCGAHSLSCECVIGQCRLPPLSTHQLTIAHCVVINCFHFNVAVMYYPELVSLWSPIIESPLFHLQLSPFIPKKAKGITINRYRLYHWLFVSFIFF